MKRKKLTAVLKALQIILLIFLVGLMVQLNVRTATQASDTKSISENTNTIVKKQGDILDAIKVITDDTKLTAAQQTNIIICMLQVPISERTTDTQEQCRTKANESPASTSDNSAQNTGNADHKVVAGSSSNSTPTNQPEQPNNVQPSQTPVQKAENFTSKVLDKLWPFN